MNPNTPACNPQKNTEDREKYYTTPHKDMISKTETRKWIKETVSSTNIEKKNGWELQRWKQKIVQPVSRCRAVQLLVQTNK